MSGCVTAAVYVSIIAPWTCSGSIPRRKRRIYNTSEIAKVAFCAKLSALRVPYTVCLFMRDAWLRHGDTADEGEGASGIAGGMNRPGSGHKRGRARGAFNISTDEGGIP